MQTILFDYSLDPERIAQHPLPERDAARLLVLTGQEMAHGEVSRFPELVPEGALVVLNDTRVIRARILAKRRETGGDAEILLLRRAFERRGTEEVWRAIGKAGRPLRPGHVLDSGPLSVRVLEKHDGELTVLVMSQAPMIVEEALERFGHVPLPPYVRRQDTVEDTLRYQTVFARESGSVAAPTAGLHLTREGIARLRQRGARVEYVTLHVGLGTFRPVTVSDLDDHPMHTESYVVTQALSDAVRDARARSAPVVAVGTTVVRALESARDPGDPRRIVPCSGETKLLIQPGYEFGPVDALLTNFHAPRSTLLALVCAFAGRDRVMAAYETALSAGYRFLSYGDAMWIPERRS